MKVPVKEVLKSVPGFFGIRLEEAPKFDVIFDGDIQIRRYDPFTVAQVTVQGARKEAAGEAFKELANFIFGENKEQEVHSMTNPVFIEATPEGWMMSFFLSPSEDLATALRPNIKIVNYPQKEVAVYQYSGNVTDEKMNEAREKLLSLLQELPLYRAVSEVYWAQYDAPLTLPFVKKNEVLVHVEKQS
jgi:DNA gyrase inhibitor GyrI